MTVPAEASLRAAMNELADQLCVAVDGDFDFVVRASIDDETIEKLTMLINFAVDLLYTAIDPRLRTG